MRVRISSVAGLAALGVVALLACIAGPHAAWAQAHNPFGVGISEGGGSATGITSWILQEQVLFERQLSATVRASRTDGSALWLLAGLSFAYGIFHAAGPGHGKAVMAAYMFANERAVRRGMILSLLAALLQGIVAIVLVSILALVMHATAQRMKDAATLVESLSYAGIAVLGLWLVWQKGRRFVLTLLDTPGGISLLPRDSGPGLAMATAQLGVQHIRPHDDGACDCFVRPMSYVPSTPASASASMAAHVHGPGCGHYHAPDPSTLGEGFSWREAILTVVAAGSRPCSGAILVLVFSLAQGMFVAGIAATLAMSLGVAITTGALALLAVLAKGFAMKVATPESRRGLLIVRGLETLAAAVVLFAGLSLFLGYTAMGGA